MKKIPAALFSTCLLSSAVAQLPVSTGTPHLIHSFQSLEDSSIDKTQPGIFGLNQGWNLYKDIIFPGTHIKGRALHNQTLLPGNKLLLCKIAGGDAYNNLFFTYTLAKKWMGAPWAFTPANYFIYSMDFYVDDVINCGTPNQSELEGLEFTFQQAMPPENYLWGLQWSKSNVWSYWDNTYLNNRVKGWVPIAGLQACLLDHQWNHIELVGYRNQNGLYYDQLYLNNVTYPIHCSVAKSLTPANWAENFLQIGFQINGNKAIRKGHRHGVDPVDVYLNNVTLKVSQR